jgi:death-on-curing protein
VRDAGILESAIEQPRASFSGQFLHAFPFEMAAAYLFHIVKNHPFVDGNKRTGTVAALVFLDWNDFEFDCQAGELSDLTLAVATGHYDKKKIAAFFQERSLRKSD